MILLYFNIANPKLDNIVELFNIEKLKIFNVPYIVVLLHKVVNPDTFEVPDIEVLFFNVVNPEIYNDDINVVSPFNTDF
jgi:hypothetical protein